MKSLITAVVVTLAAALAAPASAAAPSGTCGPGVRVECTTSSSTIDPERYGRLTIHKYLVPEGGDIDDGYPAKDVGFTVARVAGVDLTTSEGWLAASELSAADVPAITTERPVSVTTNAGGRATLADLPVGLYLVTESAPPADVDPVDPFFVTIPMTDPDRTDTWMYDVCVYPKNVAQVPPSPGPTKTTDPSSPPAALGGSKPLKPGITGSETAMLTAVAVGLLAAGAWLAVLVGRVRRRADA